jgi:hypothetical protein
MNSKLTAEVYALQSVRHSLLPALILHSPFFHFHCHFHSDLNARVRCNPHRSFQMNSKLTAQVYALQSVRRAPSSMFILYSSVELPLVLFPRFLIRNIAGGAGTALSSSASKLA